MRNQLTNLLCGYVGRFLFERDIGFKWTDKQIKIGALKAVFYIAQTYPFKTRNQT